MLRDLPKELVQGAAPEVAKALESDIQGSIAAGRAPDGAAWQLKKDGGKPLQNAGSHVTVDVVGTVVLVKLTGDDVRHHKGTARGGIRRQVLPTRKIPESVSRAISKVFGKTFQRLTGGA